ncbi:MULTISPECIES: tautomerase family protein [Aeribacillus]|uniref:tautomerase family protein n=1 Tax=Aeribacillus TaxID=1055323 RepID=UPI002285C2EA|nr:MULTISPECIES: 2-hydroxymuconate tautomerase family protein [Aeribacillus]MED1442897.1 2-hydroxymuconate tautomerase family protein [Aeribacillus composti]
MSEDKNMPIIQIQLFGSLTVEQKETLIKETSDAAAHALNVPLSTIRVLIQELPAENWGISGESAQKKLSQTKGK